MFESLSRSSKSILPRVLPVRAVVMGLLLQVLPIRSSRAEAHVDLKTLYYIEDSDRMLIVSPILLYENAITPDLTIKIDAVYNSISGATPTGAPPPPLNLTPGEEGSWTLSGASPGSTGGGTVSGASPGAPGGGTGGDDDEEGEESDHDRKAVRRFLLPFSRVSGASPGTGTATDRQIPFNEVSDTRTGVNLDVSRRFGCHTIGSQLSFSTESDYDSYGVALRDGIDFNQRNTTLILGGGWTHDIVNASTMAGPEDKDTSDLMAGLIQVLNPKTTLSFNLTLSLVNGFMDDPYKVVELNGTLVPEHRPDNKEKRIVYVSLTRFLDQFNGSLETSYRLYNDSFGITAHTLTLA